MLPRFRPSADWLQTAGDGNLLALLLAFAWREIRADIDFKSVQRFDRYCRLVPIPYFFETKDIGVELSDITVDGADLAVFFRTRGVGTPAWKPLNVPESGSDGI